MRITYLSTHYPSVSHTFIQGEILALEARGVEVLPTALNPPAAGDLLTELDERERRRTFYVKGVSRPAMARLFATVAVRHPGPFLGGLARALASGRLDLARGFKAVAQFLEGVLIWDHSVRHGSSAIHAHFGQAPAAVAAHAAAFGNAIGAQRWTWSVTIHGWHEFATEDTSQLRAKLAAADQVISISDFTRSQLLRLSGPRGWDRISVVRCGIDLAAFPVRTERPVSSPPVVVVTARLSAEKGHLVLLQALAALRRDGHELRARLIGSGPLAEVIEAEAARLGVADAVELTGALPPLEVARALREADVFCLPTFAEGLPVSIMEAMASGVPVVTTYISGIPELVVDGETGWIVPAGNVDALAAALLAATEGPGRHDVVAAARRAVEERHDRSRNVVELERLLRACHEPVGAAS